MALPRRWEVGEGRVPLLTPSLEDVERLKQKKSAHERFLWQLNFKERLASCEDLAPERLWSIPSMAFGDETRSAVLSGSTLLCACSKGDAKLGLCHRVLVAEELAKRGWKVCLDGDWLDLP
jgi:hypothetical protein